MTTKQTLNPYVKEKEKPLLTVITIVLNGVNILERTILNVINQNYGSIEYIIIDGGSTDGSLEIIRKHENRINHWISEPDAGLYDAMNKGIKIAKGEWVNFMNAGDEFYDFDVCEKIANTASEYNFDVIFGDFIAKNDGFDAEILVKAKTLKSIWKGNMFSHQSCFIRSSILRENLFITDYKIVADYNQIVSIYLKNHSFFYLPVPIARTLTGGLSYSNIKTYYEQMKVIHSHKPFTIRLWYFFIPITLYWVRTLIGPKATVFVRKIKWKYLINEG